VAGGAGVLDAFSICRKDASDVYAWVTLFTDFDSMSTGIAYGFHLVSLL